MNAQTAEHVEQLSEAWFAARLGKVTASRVADVVAKTRNGWGASRANYMAELIVERLTGTQVERFQNAAMLHGVDTEPQARDAHEFYSGQSVEQVGFIDHPTIPMTGASPDGLIGSDGMLEIKCPQTATHIETLLGGVVAERYLLQMQWQMACADRQWCDFVSYDPRMPESMAYFCRRIKRNDEQIEGLSKAISAFLAEITVKISELKDKYERAA